MFDKKEGKLIQVGSLVTVSISPLCVFKSHTGSKVSIGFHVVDL